MKNFSVRPSKFLSIIMIVVGAMLLYVMSSFPEPPEDFGAAIPRLMKIFMVGMMMFGLVNLILPRGISMELIEEANPLKHKSSTIDSFAALQQLYDKGLLTYEEYRRKVDLLTRAEPNDQTKK